ncbi:putative hemerythrin family protein [Magnetofaba australis IT-1]|uniref:Putative hemerythrin family protein n=1 Tax=Magnetofaba australis IT-1 TaxID=1434232 RepID=A0A1Y2K990_9PROT|nr:putative hemerythrin family protein [Magnetofaba australis IT-1]
MWRDEEFSVGVASLDEQHKGLFSAFMNLGQSIENVYDDKALGVMLNLLFIQMEGYVKTHLRYEELLLEKWSFPELEAHKQKHDLLENELAAYKKCLDAAEDEQKKAIAQQISLFMERWLINHIQGDDRAYGPHLRKMGVV